MDNSEKMIKQISPINFYKLYLSTTNFKIIDVREVNEYESYHILESINIPLSMLLTKHYLFLNKKYQYYVICKDGNSSYKATKELAKFGYHVTHVIGGLNAWRGEFTYETLYY